MPVAEEMLDRVVCSREQFSFQSVRFFLTWLKSNSHYEVHGNIVSNVTWGCLEMTPETSMSSVAGERLQWRSFRAASPQQGNNINDTNRWLLRSASSGALFVRPTRLVTMGDRAFPVAGSRLWNNLTYEVTSAPTLPVFSSRLKTYLFQLSFPPD